MAELITLRRFQAEDRHYHIYRIRETKVEGRRRSYILTQKGMAMLQKEYERILAQTWDYYRIFGEGEKK